METMETVEVVIRIPKTKLDRINKIANGIWGTSDLNAQEIAILNGTVLPKGHGDLKDMGMLKYVFDLTRADIIYSGKDIKKAIDSMTTIVPSDD